jgi:peptide/nickel transport system permease protein
MTAATSNRLSSTLPSPASGYQDVKLSFKHSPWYNGKLLAGASVLGLLVLGLLVGHSVWDQELAYVGSSPLNLPPVGLEYKGQVGTWAHPLGTENAGRDMLALIIIGAPRSLLIGFTAAIIGLVVGVLLGFSAGYLGGRVDDVVRLATDITMNIPGLLVLIIIQSALPRAGFFTMALLLSLFSWQGATRVFRAQVLSMKQSGYVLMARLSGSSPFDIMFKEIMPNLMPYLVSNLTFGTSYSILTMVGMEVLGLGAQRIPSLGVTLNNAISASAILRGMWWWWALPTAVLIMIFMCLLLIAVGMDEVANPRLRDA